MRMQKRLPLLLLSWALLLASCGKEEPVEIVTAIELTPEVIHLNDSVESSLLLTPIPAGIGEWRVAYSPTWLLVSPEEGNLSSSTVLKLFPDTEGLEPGTYFGEVEISSSAGYAVTEVTLTIGAKPQAQISNTNLHFPAETDSILINIGNSGTGALNWGLSAAESWIKTFPESGSLASGEETEVWITVSREDQPPGTMEGTISLASNSISGEILIPTTMEVPELALIEVSSDSLFFNYFINEQEITVKNVGNVEYSWTVSSAEGLIAIAPSSGSLAVGQSATLTLTSNRSGLTTGDHPDLLNLSNNKGESVEFQSVIRHFHEEKWLIEGEVEDAEYDKINNKLLVIVGSELRKYDFTTRSVSSVTLNLAGTSVSVSQDGNYAAVGHNGYLSYVNLSTMTLEKTLPASTNVNDVVLASNGYIYAFPTTGQWEYIRCVNISTGKETLQTGSSLYAGALAKLHPSGNYIYTADVNLSPGDLDKFDISGGTAKYMYDSPYHGDYPMGGGIWFSEDGARIFTPAGSIFRSTTDATTDMRYAGELVGENRFASIDHSSKANRIYAITDVSFSYDRSAIPVINIYDGTYNTLLGSQELPGFISPDGTGGGKISGSVGAFGFFNSSGTEFYAIVQNKDNEPEYALATITVQ